MSGGYRNYLCNVIPRMAKHNDVEAILCATPDYISVQDCFDTLPNVRFVGCKPFRFLRPHRDVELLRELERFSPDVIFVPIERSFRFGEVPVVNMLQNMEPFISDISGNLFNERFRNWARRIDGKKALRNSNRVVAISKFVRHFLVEQWNIPDEKIGLVYHGIDVNRNGASYRPHVIPEIWHNQFIFTAGSIRPARGLEDLLLAVNHLALQGPDSVRLVVAGEAEPRMTGHQKKLKDWIQTHNLSSKVCWAGDLNGKEMAWCYQNCQVFVMTSRVESFGMIGGEAMSHGCICISADNPCLPELFGDGAVYYPPKDGKALAEAIKNVLSWDDNQRKAMSEKARKRAGEFSWDVCAEKTVAELAKAAESRQSGKL